MLETSENLNNQAIELASQGDYAEAIACFQRAISIEKENYLLWFNLGLTYRDAGNINGARAALEKAYGNADAYIDAAIEEAVRWSK